MNVKEIIQQYLQANGYDGLCNGDIECGCALVDLMPCGEYGSECEPGYKGMKDDGDWVIETEKPGVKK